MILPENPAGPTRSGSGCVSCCSCGHSCLLQPSPGPLEASQGLTCDPRSYSLGLSSRPRPMGHLEPGTRDAPSGPVLPGFQVFTRARRAGTGRSSLRAQPLSAPRSQLQDR